MDARGTGFVNTSTEPVNGDQRLRALERANRVRVARAELKRHLRHGEVAAGDAILRGSRDTDTMTVADLLLCQPGWGPTRCSRMLRSVALPQRKTLGSLTERQRLMLAALLAIDAEHDRRSAPP
jgi:hypothetical protein